MNQEQINLKSSLEVLKTQLIQAFNDNIEISSNNMYSNDAKYFYHKGMAEGYKRIIPVIDKEIKKLEIHNQQHSHCSLCKHFLLCDKAMFYSITELKCLDYEAR